MMAYKKPTKRPGGPKRPKPSGKHATGGLSYEVQAVLVLVAVIFLIGSGFASCGAEAGGFSEPPQQQMAQGTADTPDGGARLALEVETGEIPWVEILSVLGIGGAAGGGHRLWRRRKNGTGDGR